MTGAFGTGGISDPPAGNGGGPSDWIVRDVQPISAQPLRASRDVRPPPSADALLAEGLVAPESDPYRYVDARARKILAWLEARGMRAMRSVKVSGREGSPTADIVFNHQGTLSTLEIKTVDAASSSAINGSIRAGRRQSRLILVDCRQAGVGREVGETGIRRGVRDSGNDIDQVILVLVDGSAIGWKR